MTSVSAWLRPGGCTIMRTRSPALQSPCVCGWIDAHKQTDVSRVHLVLHFLPGEGEVLRRRTLLNKRRATPSMTLSLLPNVEGFPSLCVCVCVRVCVCVTASRPNKNCPISTTPQSTTTPREPAPPAVPTPSPPPEHSELNPGPYREIYEIKRDSWQRLRAAEKATVVFHQRTEPR